MLKSVYMKRVLAGSWRNVLSPAVVLLAVFSVLFTVALFFSKITSPWQWDSFWSRPDVKLVVIFNLHLYFRRGAWFLHDLSGHASQLSLPCMTRLECRSVVFDAQGDAGGMWDGERTSFLTNSPHIARPVEGSKHRENPDSCDV